MWIIASIKENKIRGREEGYYQFLILRQQSLSLLVCSHKPKGKMMYFSCFSFSCNWYPFVLFFFIDCKFLKTSKYINMAFKRCGQYMGNWHVSQEHLSYLKKFSFGRSSLPVSNNSKKNNGDKSFDNNYNQEQIKTNCYPGIKFAFYYQT